MDARENEVLTREKSGVISCLGHDLRLRSGRSWPVLGVVSASGVLQVSIYTVRPSWTKILDFIQFVTSKHVDLYSDLGDIPQIPSRFLFL